MSTGVPLKLIDTAESAIQMTKLKRSGVERSRKALGAADLVLLLIDSSNELTDEDRQLLEANQGQAADHHLK